VTADDADEAVANGEGYSSYDVGMCLKFVRGPCWEIGSFFGSAIDAWNGAADKHPGDPNPPRGAPCFYRGGQYGHVVISNGEQIRSTDCQSSGRVSNAALSWPSDAWNYDYLGWTGDLNGVDLPLSTAPPDTGGDDDMPQYDHAGTNVKQALPAGEWIGIKWSGVASGPAFVEGEPQCRIAGRTYVATLHVTVSAPAGSTIRLRTVERESGEDAESNPQTEVVATGGGTYGLHVQSGVVAKGRDLRFRVCCDSGGELTAADAVVLSW
jgi:hypothetical protein